MAVVTSAVAPNVGRARRGLDSGTDARVREPKRPRYLPKFLRDKIDH